VKNNSRGKRRGQLADQARLAPSSAPPGPDDPALTNSNTCARVNQKPIVTLYVYKRGGRPVACGFGQAPPDPGSLRYDSILRIPVVFNGYTPTWRAFECKHNQTPTAAYQRAVRAGSRRRRKKKQVAK